MRRFFHELYRRNVLRAATLYLAFAWLLIQASHLLDHAMGVSGTSQRYLMVMLTIGFIPVFLFSWRYELTEQGLEDEERIPHPKRVHHPLATRLDRATIILLLVAYLLALIDQFAVEPRSPHRYAPIAEAVPAQDESG